MEGLTHTGVISRRKTFAIGISTIAAGLLLFALVTIWVLSLSGLSDYDHPLSTWVQDHRSDGLTTFFTVVTTLFGEVALTLITGIVCVTWIIAIYVRSKPARFSIRSYISPLLLGVSMIVAVCTSTGIKHIVDRARPPMEYMLLGADDSWSYPSGHTLGAGVFLGVLGYLFWRSRPTKARLVSWIAVATIGTILVALSRVYLGYHWLTDTVAAMSLALVISGIAICVDRLLISRQSTS